jgi:hypothetical protein
MDISAVSGFGVQYLQNVQSFLDYLGLKIENLRGQPKSTIVVSIVSGFNSHVFLLHTCVGLSYSRTDLELIYLVRNARSSFFFLFFFFLSFFSATIINPILRKHGGIRSRR